MATDAEIKTAFVAAAAILQAADFRIEDGKAWAEPGDIQVQGFDVYAVVRAALNAAERQRAEAGPMPLDECEAFAEDLIDAAGLDIGSGLTAAEMRRAYGRAIFQAQTGRPVLPE